MLSRFSDNGHHEMSSMSAQVHVQSSALSGGVAIGVAMTAVHTPWIAMTIGFCAALLSALGFRYMKVKPHQSLNPNSIRAVKCNVYRVWDRVIILKKKHRKHFHYLK